jgi:threonine/homoserine/homoserine lactone efflux protein
MLGLATGSVIQAVAAAFGLSALFVYSPLAFAIVKYCGATYLVYLGIADFLLGGLGMPSSFMTTALSQPALAAR